jgi:hypothetical protein
LTYIKDYNNARTREDFAHKIELLPSGRRRFSVNFPFSFFHDR